MSCRDEPTNITYYFQPSRKNRYYIAIQLKHPRMINNSSFVVIVSGYMHGTCTKT